MEKSPGKMEMTWVELVTELTVPERERDEKQLSIVAET